MFPCAGCVRTSSIPPSLKWLKDRHNKEIIMIDYARKPGRQQAVKLNFVEVILRRLCYLLAQKGNPVV